ncbi:hypothetical protein [Streptomyces sp. NPDC088766]|uniref:hypothetical protein n=1 Tax=Streptomyces sp. NPDC088766 TaxID=3365893 RepID=UPI0038026608
MEETTGDVEPYHHAHYSTPLSQRELSSLHLAWAVASDGAEKKHVLYEAEMTVEELGEHFDVDRSGSVDGG